MLGARSVYRGIRPAALLVGIILVTLAVSVGVPTSSGAQTAQGGVTLEWFGHMVYRITSPQGQVVVTSPWLDNPDGPVELSELARTDIVLIPNAHNDDMGSPIELAAVSGATVVAPGPLGAWLIENGLPRDQFFRTNIAGGSLSRGDTTIKVGPSAHDNTLPNGADGGPAASFFINFDNGSSIFFSGHATMIADLAIYASVYQPEIAILGLTEAPEFAQVARLIRQDNPKLRVVIPSHIRPGTPLLNQARREMERLGLGELLLLPELRRVYTY
jgi:L-ascorbate metabolism protein UlaG (beta-lactamase superfamily)